MAENKKNNTQAPEEEEMEVITLEFDDGEKADCEIMGIFDYNGKDYVALIPDDGTDDVWIYGYEEDEEGAFELIDITDDKLFEAVAKEFESIMQDPEVHSVVLESLMHDRHFRLRNTCLRNSQEKYVQRASPQNT